MQFGLPGSCEHWCPKGSNRGLSANQNARALISMMARSKCSNQRPDTLMRDRSPPARRNHLQRTAGPYIGSKTEVVPLEWHVGSTPKSRHRQATPACPFRAKLGSRRTELALLFFIVVSRRSVCIDALQLRRPKSAKL